MFNEQAAELVALRARVEALEARGSERSVRGVTSGQRSRRTGGSPIIRERRGWRGRGTEESPYTLVEIEEPEAGPSRRRVADPIPEEIRPGVTIEEDPVPPYEE